MIIHEVGNPPDADQKNHTVASSLTYKKISIYPIQESNDLFPKLVSKNPAGDQGPRLAGILPRIQEGRKRTGFKTKNHKHIEDKVFA